MDNLPDAIFEADPTGRIVLARGRVEPIFGAPGERFLGQSFNSLVVPDDRPLLSRLLHAEAPSPHDVRITRPDDAVRVCEVSLHRASEGITRAIFRDQTEQREWETKIQEAQSIAQSRERLATIGMMTAGVAHEINNPLAFIGANLRYVKDALKPLVAAPDASPELSAAREAIDESLEGFNRITRIVNALRGTARNAPNERVVFWPAHALREAVTVFTGAKRGVCSVEEDLPEVSQVVGSPSGLAQVVLNLLQNGLDAMDGHGQLGVRCRDQDKEVWVEVWDRGPGIPEEVQARMFLPFYTTKAFGKGTGLGLHLCKGIVAEMDGQLTYTTGPAGTTFRIQLPQLEAEEG